MHCQLKKGSLPLFSSVSPAIPGKLLSSEIPDRPLLFPLWNTTCVSRVHFSSSSHYDFTRPTPEAPFGILLCRESAQPSPGELWRPLWRTSTYNPENRLQIRLKSDSLTLLIHFGTFAKLLPRNFLMLRVPRWLLRPSAENALWMPGNSFRWPRKHVAGLLETFCSMLLKTRDSHQFFAILRNTLRCPRKQAGGSLEPLS